MGSDRAAPIPTVPEAHAQARRQALALSERGGPWSRAEIEALGEKLVVDPFLMETEAAFRAKVLESLPAVLAPGQPEGDEQPARTFDPELIHFALYELWSRLRPGLPLEDDPLFAPLDAIEAAWGAVPRRAMEREALLPDLTLTIPDEGRDRVAASLYSFPSALIAPERARALLEAVRALDPERALVALTDLPMTRALAEDAERLGVTLLETHGLPYSPWPRDPFLAARTAGGGTLFLERPDRQRGREMDRTLAREVIQGLPDALDGAWGEPRWATAETPFHNGQLLFVGGAVWASAHSFETAVLEHLGTGRLPVETFATPEGAAAYRRALEQSARSAEALYGRPVRWVHPLPDVAAPGSAEPAAEAPTPPGWIEALGGGAGFDLDSLVTLLPGRGDAPLQALVGDPSLAPALLEASTAEDLQAFRATYGLDAAASLLRSELLAGTATARTKGLDRFLDAIAQHLEAQGLAVTRLPLLLVSTDLLNGHGSMDHEDFLVGWQNVVLTPTDDGALTAEGFTSGLPPGDLQAKAAFARAGAPLHLLPTLPTSVLLNGGYRCASNQVRSGPRR